MYMHMDMYMCMYMCMYMATYIPLITAHNPPVGSVTQGTPDA